jgi:hypothetical protein
MAAVRSDLPRNLGLARLELRDVLLASHGSDSLEAQNLTACGEECEGLRRGGRAALAHLLLHSAGSAMPLQLAALLPACRMRGCAQREPLIGPSCFVLSALRRNTAGTDGAVVDAVEGYLKGTLQKIGIRFA